MVFLGNGEIGRNKYRMRKICPERKTGRGEGYCGGRKARERGREEDGGKISEGQDRWTGTK
jgi:hypothetical protein